MSVCSGSVVRVASTAPSSAPVSIGPVVSRSSERDFRRPRRPRGASLLLVVGLVLVVLVVVLVVVVAAQQPVGELAQPLGDLVHRGGRGHQQAEEGEQAQQDDGDDGADAGDQRGADRPADQATGARPAHPRVGRRPDDVGDAEHRGDQAQPADGQAAPGLGSRTAAEQPQGGEEQHDRQHHEQRADDPADGVGQSGADRADAVAPRRGAQHDRQTEDGEADPVAPVLGRQRFGLLRSGDRPGQAAGAAGQQVPAPADHAPQAGRALLLARDDGSRDAWRPAASCSQPSSRSLGSGRTPDGASTWCGQACVGR